LYKEFCETIIHYYLIVIYLIELSCYIDANLKTKFLKLSISYTKVFNNLLVLPVFILSISLFKFLRFAKLVFVAIDSDFSCFDLLLFA